MSIKDYRFKSHQKIEKIKPEEICEENKDDIKKRK